MHSVGRAGLVLLVLMQVGLMTCCRSQKIAGTEKPSPRQAAEGRVLLKEAQREIAKDPQSAYWHRQASLAYAITGDYASARKEIEQAIRLEPENPGHYYLAAQISQSTKDRASEVTALRRALSLDPLNPHGHFALADALEREGKPEEALREYQAALERYALLKDNVYYDSHGNVYTFDTLEAESNRRIEGLRKARR